MWSSAALRAASTTQPQEAKPMRGTVPQKYIQNVGEILPDGPKEAKETPRDTQNHKKAPKTEARET